VDLDQDCRDAFLEVIRLGAPRPAHLSYELPWKELIPSIREFLDAQESTGRKLEIRFYLPSEAEPDPEEMTLIRVYFVP
jgi:hypothetical protein